jgi:hypothetical protein
VLEIISRISRHLAGKSLLESVKPFIGKEVVGIGLGGREYTYKAREFVDIYNKAREYGAHLTVHAGETSGSQSIWDALEQLHAERIGHGIRAVEDISSGNGQPEFLMTLIDLSPSMEDDDWKPSRKAGAIKANIELIKLKARHHPQDMAGVIGFGSYAELLHDPVKLADGARSICDSLRHIPDPDGTNFTAALKMAEDCFRGAHKPLKNNIARRPLMRALSELFYEPDQHVHGSTRELYTNKGMTRRIILLTDGEHNGFSNPEKVADRLKNAGVIIDCIGIGGTPADVDEKLLKKIASRNPDGSIRYCFIGDKDSLIRKYETLAMYIRPA